MTGPDNFPYIASLAAGVLTFLSPCVLPLIPVYISFITGVSVNELENPQGAGRSGTFFSALCFVLGFSFVFVMFGASASYFGGLLGRHRELIRWIGGAAVIVFGLHLSGVLRIKQLYLEKRVDSGKIAEGYIGAFLVGVAFAAGWTPCIGPILSSILILASTQDTVYKGMLLLFLYALGMGIPFLLTALFINWALGIFSRIKKFYGYIEAASGVILVLVGLLMITDGFKVFSRFVERLAG